jgi:hypothetical protein
MTFDPPLWMQNTSKFEYSARLDRGVLGVLFTEGLLDNLTMGAVTARTTPPLLAVDVATADAVIKGDDVPRQGHYFTRLVAGETVTFDAPPSTGSRIDRIVMEILDGSAVDLAGRPEGPRLRAVTGTATTGTPVAPALPPTAISLATVVVAAGASAITQANITDTRPLASSANYSVTTGTNLAQMTTAQRDALTGADLYLGRSIWNTTVGEAQVYSGTVLKWQPIFPIAGDSTTLSYYSDGTLQSVQERLGGSLIRTKTMTYTGGNLTQVTETGFGRTVTTTLNYTGGQFTGTTRAVS